MSSVNSYYNKSTRHILGKVDFFFDGFENEPFTADMSSCLVDFELVEEASAESKNPLGSTSANELTVTLTNFDNMFSPSNTEGPYYGKIKTGVMVKPYLKPGDGSTDWVPLGVYFVSEWNSRMGSAMAFITCHDIVQELLLSPIPGLSVKLDITYAELFRYMLDAYGYTTATIDSELTDKLSYGFIAYDNTPDTLQALVEAAISMLISTRDGSIAVKKLRRSTPVDTFTDSTQIISADVEQSIIKTYNGVKLTYVLPQLSDFKEILGVDALAVPAGETTHNMLKFADTVHSISAVTLRGSTACKIKKYTATNFGISLVTSSSSEEAVNTNLSVTGKSLDLVEQELNDELSNMLEVYNPYIQSSSYAGDYKDRLNRFVNTDIPTLSLTIRGNPEVLVGDTVVVDSAKYKLYFVGIVKRSTIRYAGNLTCTMDLLNAEVLS